MIENILMLCRQASYRYHYNTDTSKLAWFYYHESVYAECVRASVPLTLEGSG